ncbi:unnamed protein product [Symbiodinium microadriaticum]|nr:unnamed protein product [Symbiodinium microadriaticum]
MGGWPPDTLAADVLAKANEMARDLQLQISMADAFVPGVRRGFVLIPISPRDGESEEAMRQRIQSCIRRVNASNISLGWKPDGNQARLWLTLSQPPERRRRAALAGKVKRLIIEAGGSSLVPRIEPEWATGTVWLKDTKVSSGTSAGPTGSSGAGCGWIDLPKIAELIGVDPQQLAKTWDPLLAPQQGVPPRAQRENLHFATWNLGGMSPEAVLDFLSNFRGDKPLARLCIVFLQEITTQGGPYFLDNDTWMLVHGKQQPEWRGCGVAFRKTLGVHHASHLKIAACTVIDYVASRNLPVDHATVGCYRARSDHEPILASAMLPTPPGPKGKVIWCARQLKADCHQVLASASLAYADDHHAIAAIAKLITEPVHRSMKFQESTDLKCLRKAAKGANPGPEARNAWKQVSKALQRERREWQRKLSDQAGAMQWNAYRAIKQKASRTNWAEHLLDKDDWEGDLRKHMTSIFAKRQADTTSQAMQGMREACSRMCKSRPWRPFSEAEMRITMSKWKKHKATGTDGVALEALQLLFEDPKWRPRIAELLNDSSPDSPVLFAAAIGETLDAVLAFMDDTYVWGESPEYVQEVLSELEKKFLELGLRINAKKTHVVSSIPDDPFRFVIGGVTVAPDGPHSIMTILGAPVTLSGVIAPLVAEMQSRARCAFQANRRVALPHMTRGRAVQGSDGHASWPTEAAKEGGNARGHPPRRLRLLSRDYVNNELMVNHHPPRIGFAPTYDPATDPWHEDGTFEGISAEMGALLSGQPQYHGAQPGQYAEQTNMMTQPYDPWEDDLVQMSTAHPAQGQPTQQGHLGHHRGHLATSGPQMPGAGHFDPPTMDPWGVIARQHIPSPSMSEASTCANEPDEPNCVEVTPGDAEDAAPEVTTSDAAAPHVAEDADDELVDTQEELDWESDLSDSEDEDDEPMPAAAQAGGQPPKRKAGHGSQRVTNKAKKSDVKKRWRELDWGKKPKWLSWRKALDYILRGEKPPAKAQDYEQDQWAQFPKPVEHHNIYHNVNHHNIAGPQKEMDYTITLFRWWTTDQHTSKANRIDYQDPTIWTTRQTLNTIFVATVWWSNLGTSRNPARAPVHLRLVNRHNNPHQWKDPRRQEGRPSSACMTWTNRQPKPFNRGELPRGE